MRGLFQTGGWFVVLVTAAGCGSGLVAHPDGGAGAPGTGGVGGAAGGSGGLAGGGGAAGAGGVAVDDRPACTAPFVQASAAGGAPAAPAAGTCVVEPAPCKSACSLPGCTVISDAVIRCADVDVARRGLRVAPTGSGTYVAATSDTETHLLQIAATSTGIELVPPLSGDFGAPLMLAVDGTGNLHALGKQPGGTIGHAVQGAIGVFATDSIPASVEAGYSEGAAAFEVGPDGDPHALLAIGPDVWSLARSQSGQWTVDPPGAASNLTLDPSDGEVTFEVDAADAGMLSLVARGGGTAWPGYPVPNSADFRVTQALAAPAAATLAPFGVASYDGTALHLAWPSPSGPYTDLVIPNTPPAPAACPSVVQRSGASCSGSCMVQEYGLENHAFSVGRTDDGAAWLGYVATHVDRSCRLALVASDTQQVCSCVSTGDQSTGELHLLRGAPDGSQPVEALVLPLEPPFASDLADDLPLISVRAFGSRVAAAARVHDSTPKLRVITLEIGAAD